MIPRSIMKEHVILAIDELRKNGIPDDRQSTKYDLVLKNEKYPPKLVISLAAKFAIGRELDSNIFSGGNETNDFLMSLGFEIGERRKDWDWSECYFAVWVYDQLDLDRKQVKSVLYREVADLIGRSAKSVEFKIQNVSSFDPRPRKEKPIAEAANAQVMLGDVFFWYWNDRDQARLRYWDIREKFELEVPSSSELGAASSVAFAEVIIEEGAVASSPSSRRKRSQKLLQAGRAFFKKLDPDGLLRCQACGFLTPEGVPIELIQLHHSEPIYEADQNGRLVSLEQAIKNLIPLCPTCHALAHTSKPPSDVARIKEALKISTGR